jgi:dTDP-glucose pyrophosphorylase
MPDDLKNFIIVENATIREAMKAINAGGLSGVVMVNGTDGTLAGLMTDGDVRRMLLAGAEMDTLITAGINRDFTWVNANTSRAHVLDLMRARGIEHIPILDQDRRLIGVHRLGDVLSQDKLKNIAVIMAGGKGTRLGTLTIKTPKPMLKVAGRPILERIVLHLVGAGIREIYIAVNYLSHVIEDHFRDGASFGCKIHYLREKEPLGSGGALGLLPEIPDHPLLVMNGDLVTEFHVRRMLKYHAAGGYLATMGLTAYTHQIPFGCVQVSHGRVVGFTEKPVLSELVNSGIYTIAPELLKRVTPGYFPITNLFESCIEKNEPVGAYTIEEEWADIGVPEELNLAQGNL